MTMQQMLVDDIKVIIRYKKIKHIYIDVIPPAGEVIVSSPVDTADNIIYNHLLKNLAWIRKSQQDFLKAVRQEPIKLVDNEEHYLWGRKCRLRIVNSEQKKHHIILSQRNKCIELHVQESTSLENKKKVLDAFYREELQKKLLPLISKWEEKLGVKAKFVGIKRMRTKWGTCGHYSQRLWFNLELAKKPVDCLEYVVVHELIHLLENSHNERFKYLLYKHMPNFQQKIQMLNERCSLAHEEFWGYEAYAQSCSTQS